MRSTPSFLSALALFSLACAAGAADPDSVGGAAGAPGGFGPPAASDNGGAAGATVVAPGDEGGTGALPGAAGMAGAAPPAGAAGAPVDPSPVMSDGPGPAGARGLPPPAGLIGLFVASGNGGRTVISCDEGRSWIAQHKYSDSNDDHHAHTHKGFAHGKGKLVQLMGWGQPPSIKVSDNGVDWVQRSVTGKENGTIVFDGETFVIASGSASTIASDPAGTWSRGGATNHGTHVRGGGGGPAKDGRGAVLAGGSDAVPVVSWNGGVSWSRATGCPPISFHNLGQLGGAAFGDGKLVVVSMLGAGCVLGGQGAPAAPIRLPSGAQGKIDWVGDLFVVASRSRLFFSRDGKSWSTALPQPAGKVNLHDVDVSDKGTFVAIGNAASDFFRSEDGVTWTRVTGPSGGTLIDLEWVHAKPSAMCP